MKTIKKIKTLALGLLLSLTILTSCSTPEEETQQEDCTMATILTVYPAPLLQPERQMILIANNCTGMEHQVWTYTYVNPQVGQQVPWR